METIKKKNISTGVRVVMVIYGVGVLVLILLSAANYPVQWRDQVNKERHRYLEVLAQAIRYYADDHDGVLFEIPAEPVVISNSDSCLFVCPALGRTLQCYNLTEQLVPAYMHTMFRDPLLTSQEDTGFYISAKDGKLTLGACYHFFKDPLILTGEL